MKALNILPLVALSLSLTSSVQAQFRMPHIRFGAQDLENIRAAAAKAAAAAGASAGTRNEIPAAKPADKQAAGAAAPAAGGAAAFRRDFMPPGRFVPPSANIPVAPVPPAPPAAPKRVRRDDPAAAPAGTDGVFGSIPEPGFVMPGGPEPEGTVVQTADVVEIEGGDVTPSDAAAADDDTVVYVGSNPVSADDGSASPASPGLQARSKGSSGSSGSSWASGAFKSNWASTWKVTKDTYGQANRALVPDPTGSASGNVLQITYPAGTRNPKDGNVGGTGFYASPIDLSAASTVTFSYQVLFPTGFNFVKGGKLPGLYGGHPGCSGGNSALDCFSTRFMFRTKGLGEIYLYVDRSLQVDAFCNVPPVTLCNPTYGASIGRGSYSFTPGKWTSVSQTITLNTLSGKTPKQNGRVQVTVNGKKVIDFAQVVFIPDTSVSFGGIDFETFFGGNDDSWITPTTQQVYFKNFALSSS
ncbi:hypothetical protein HDU87_008301 [Geranomyces variabilis]|uniref:Polysaccharide lyase 14 domain-containing protein n=1 Tax=Geranomyces variabilis TaxID=109894 RepID=A0AAD5TFH1_9FUNG|nr:hypothetical protein HDU87_008301 [Geranomyces variabilis]